MNIQFFTPCKELSRYIKLIWVLNVDEPCKGFYKIIPSGLINLYFHFNGGTGGISSKKDEQQKINSLITGQFSEPYSYNVSDNRGFISFTLFPHSASKILGIPAGEICNAAVDLNNIWGNSVSELVEKINLYGSIQEKIKLIEKYLITKINSSKLSENAKVKTAVANIELNGGRIKIALLSNKICTTSRTLERYFSESVGTSPKNFAKIIRVQKVLQLVSMKKFNSLTELAFAVGYFDQSHFITDFKKITGYTPSKYFKICDPISDYYSSF